MWKAYLLFSFVSTHNFDGDENGPGEEELFSSQAGEYGFWSENGWNNFMFCKNKINTVKLFASYRLKNYTKS